MTYFSAFGYLPSVSVGRQEEHPTCKNWVMGCWCGCLAGPLERGADCLHVVQLTPLHPITLSSLASFKCRLVLPFLYRLTQDVLEKRPLNGCTSSSCCCCSSLVVFHFSSVRVMWTRHNVNAGPTLPAYVSVLLSDTLVLVVYIAQTSTDRTCK